MSKIISISIFSVVASMSLASCSGGGKGNPSSNSADSSKLSGEDNTHKSQFSFNEEKCVDIIQTNNDLAEKTTAIQTNIEFKLTKENLCKSIDSTLNKGQKPVNAYSKMWEANISLVDQKSSQDSYSSLLKDGKLLPPYFVKDWISHDNMGSTLKKVLAFGEMPSAIQGVDYQWLIDEKENKVERKTWGIWDVRYVDEDGKVFKATENDKNAAKYVLEAELGKDYIKSVFGAFVVPGANNSSQVYFLKKTTKAADPNVEGSVETNEYTYDVKEYKEAVNDEDGKASTPAGYVDIDKDKKISDLFPTISEKDLANIDYIQKVDDKHIALFTKSSENNVYSGYYFVSTDDLKKSDVKLTFVKAKTDIIQKSCTDADSPNSWKPICTVMSDKSFNITVADIGRNDNLPYIFDYQNAKYYFINQNGILSEKKDFKVPNIDSKNTLFQVSNRNENRTWYISLDESKKSGSKYARYTSNNTNPDFVDMETSSSNWKGQVLDKSVADELKNTIATYPKNIANKNESIFLFKNGTYVDYDLNGYGNSISSGYVKDLFPLIKTADFEKINAAFNLDDKIYLMLKDKSGFYEINKKDKEKDGETIFVKNPEHELPKGK